MKILLNIIYMKSRQFIYDEGAATAIEYGLIAALIGLAIIGGMQAFGGSLVDLWNGIEIKTNGIMNSG